MRKVALAVIGVLFLGLGSVQADEKPATRPSYDELKVKMAVLEKQVQELKKQNYDLQDSAFDLLKTGGKGMSRAVIVALLGPANEGYARQPAENLCWNSGTWRIEIVFKDNKVSEINQRKSTPGAIIHN